MENRLDIICKWLYDHNECMTNLRLQKLLYFIQAYMLVAYKRPAFDQDIVAWRYGPVVVEAYENIKDNENYYSNLPEEPLHDRELEEVLIGINNSLGFKNVYDLVDLTHSYPTWKEPWDNEGWNALIEQRKIREYHYRRVIQQDGEIF